MNTTATIIVEYIPLLLQGTAQTIVLWVASLIISLICGTLWGILRCRQLRVKLTMLAGVLDAISFLLRGIPFYVQLLIAYFVFPDLFNITIPATTTAISTLGLCSAAYVSQIVRGGINALSKGQWTAAKALGYTNRQTIRFIIIQQTVRVVLPSLINEFDQLLKSTSIISALGILELTRAGMNIIARTMVPMPVYLTIAMIYLILSTLLNVTGYYCERKCIWS